MTGVKQGFADGGVALAQPRRTTGGAAILAITSLSSSLVFASSALLTVTLVAVGRDLSLSPFQLQWLVNAEILPLAALTLMAGALGDRFGQRPIFLLGILLFGVGALGSAAAPSWATLLGARLICGVGEALILPNALAILGQAFAAIRKAYAVGVWSATAAVASAVAPALGGVILRHGAWQAAFALMIVPAALALLLAIIWTPKGAAQHRAPVDWAGAGLSAAGLAALGWGLTALTNGTGASFAGMGAIAISALALLLLLTVERRRGARAMLPLTLFSERSVLGVNLFTAFLYGAFTAILTLLPFVMIQGVHLSPVVAGAAFIPLQALITIASPLAGRLCRRIGRRAPLIIGGAVMATSCLMGLRVGPDATYWPDIFPMVATLSIGMSLVVAPLSTLVLTSVAPERAGTAAGVNSAVSRAGSLVAVALLGGVLQGGPHLVDAFHSAMIGAAAACGLAVLAAFIIAPGPHMEFTARD